jgi:hypothetical protein
MINKYLKYWDHDLFGYSYEHPCSVRAVLSILTKKMEKECFGYSSQKMEVQHLIREVALECGFKK